MCETRARHLLGLGLADGLHELKELLGQVRASHGDANAISAVGVGVATSAPSLPVCAKGRFIGDFFI